MLGWALFSLFPLTGRLPLPGQVLGFFNLGGTHLLSARRAPFHGFFPGPQGTLTIKNRRCQVVPFQGFYKIFFNPFPFCIGLGQVLKGRKIFIIDREMKPFNGFLVILVNPFAAGIL